MFHKYTIHQEIKTRVSDRLVDLVLAIQKDLDVEFDLDSTEWHDIEESITSHLLNTRIQSESEIEQDILDNHADALSDESRGR
tara:strand:+ start:224 stop:472 length:249 start_codon:yes stop_codon:yes gene_type:complete